MTEQERALAIALALAQAKHYLRAALDLAEQGVTPDRRHVLLMLAAKAEWMRRSFLIALNPAQLELVAVGGPMDGRAVHLELDPATLMQSHGQPVLIERTAAAGRQPLFNVQLGESSADGYAYRLDLKTCRLHFLGLNSPARVYITSPPDATEPWTDPEEVPDVR